MLDDAAAVEALGPPDEQTFGEALLTQRKAEGEAEGQDLLLELEVLDEEGETLGNVIEKLLTRAQHQALRYCVDFTFHVETLTVQRDQQNSEVGTTQVQRQEVALL